MVLVGIDKIREDSTDPNIPILRFIASVIESLVMVNPVTNCCFENTQPSTIIVVPSCQVGITNMRPICRTCFNKTFVKGVDILQSTWPLLDTQLLLNLKPPFADLDLLSGF